MSSKVNVGTVDQPATAGEQTLQRVLSWLVPALLTPLVVFQLGYGFQEANHSLLLPWILHRIDPSLLANDWFSTTIPHHLNFVRFFAWMARFVPLPQAMLVFHVLILFLFLWTAYQIVPLLFNDRGVFFVALYLFFRWGTDGLGSNGLWANYLLPHYGAVSLSLLAFYLALKGKPVAAAAAAAAATWVHIQLGAHTMLVLGLGMLLSARRTGLRPILTSGLLYLLLVGPTLAPQWALWPLAIALAAAAVTAQGLRAQKPLLPAPWQLPAVPASSRP